MFLLIISLIVVAPLIELYVIVQVGENIGILPTIALLIAVSAVGTSLIKREGLKVYKEFVAAIQRGEEPAEQLVHGVCLLAAGVLMLAPGFISDIVSITLLVPPTRKLITTVVLRKSKAKVTVIRATHTGPIVEFKGQIGGTHDIIDVDPHEGESKQ